MAINIFDSVVLTGAITLREPRWSLFADLFRRQSPSSKEVFELHTRVRGHNILPVVSNYSAGVMVQPEGWEIGQVRAPRFRTKRACRAADIFFHRQFGGTPFDMTSGELDRAMADDLDAHREDHDRMLEIMCAQAAVQGKVTLANVDAGNVVPKVVVDFQRPASHVVNVANADKWSTAGTDLFGQIEAANMLMQEDCDGMSATDLIMGAKAFAAFRKHNDVRDNIDQQLRLTPANLNTTIGSLNRGWWNGLNLWVYSGTYTDYDGTTKHFIDPNAALLVTRSAQSVIEYGRPVDLDCSGPAQYFVKTYKEEDPSGMFSVAESRPLPVCRHAGWTVLFNNVSA